LTTGQDLNYAFDSMFLTPFQIKDSTQYLKHTNYLYFEDVFKYFFSLSVLIEYN